MSKNVILISYLLIKDNSFSTINVEKTFLHLEFDADSLNIAVFYEVFPDVAEIFWLLKKYVVMINVIILHRMTCFIS